MQNFDHNIGFWEKRQFFRRKLSKIAENCDHNIGPVKTEITLNMIAWEKTEFFNMNNTPYIWIVLSRVMVLRQNLRCSSFLNWRTMVKNKPPANHSQQTNTGKITNLYSGHNYMQIKQIVSLVFVALSKYTKISR
jgi:hypothetical protein